VDSKKLPKLQKTFLCCTGKLSDRYAAPSARFVEMLSSLPSLASLHGSSVVSQIHTILLILSRYRSQTGVTVDSLLEG
jgi:hypothetical protein